jgi:hypothetical protein
MPNQKRFWKIPLIVGCGILYDIVSTIRNFSWWDVLALFVLVAVFIAFVRHRPAQDI